MRKLVLAAALAAACPAMANRLGTWNTVQASYGLGNGVSAGVSEESRIGVDRSETGKKLDEFHTTAFVDWKVLDFMSVGLQDDLVYLRNGSDARYRRDNRPGVNVAFSGSLSGWDFSDRSRFVMRDLEGERPYFRYRNLAKAVAPSVGDFWKFRSVRPYASYEWYFDEGSKDRKIRKGDKFCQFWTDFGVQAKVGGSCSVAAFYRLVELKAGGAWNPGHVVGLALSFSF